MINFSYSDTAELYSANSILSIRIADGLIQASNFIINTIILLIIGITSGYIRVSSSITIIILSIGIIRSFVDTPGILFAMIILNTETISGLISTTSKMNTIVILRICTQDIKIRAFRENATVIMMLTSVRDILAARIVITITSRRFNNRKTICESHC